METSENYGRQLTLDELISSQEASPANPTHSQASERERRTNATCGPRCCALFENAPRATSWAKTFAALLVGTGDWYSRRCALTGKLVGTAYNRSYFQLQVSALAPTEEIASGLLLTPTTREEVINQDKFKARMKKYDNGTTMPNLATQVATLLPTPTTQEPTTACELTDRGRRKTKDGKDSHSLNIGRMAVMGMLPTPTCQDAKEKENSPSQQHKTNELAIRLAGGTNSHLSPLFVEEMMGFPKNWTASPFQSGEEKA